MCHGRGIVSKSIRCIAVEPAAAVVQGFRTSDAAFLLFQNEKLQRYKTLFDLADTVYLVTEVSIPALRNARRLMAYVASLERNVEVILNRFNAREIEIDENSATKALARPVDWKIPNDFHSVRTAENTGVPLVMKDSPISRVMHKMAIKAAGKPAQVEKKSKALLRLFH